MSDIKINLKDKEQYEVQFSELDKRVFPRVSSIIGEHVDKSIPLQHWAVNTSLGYLRHRFEECDNLEELRPVIFDDNLWKKAKDRSFQVAKEEADKGTRVHRVIEAIFRAELDGTEFTMQTEKDIENPVDAFLKWKRDNDVHPIILEDSVYAMLPGQEEVPEQDRMGYAGRLDSVLFINGEVKTVDVKTGKAVYEDQKFQIGAYDYAFKYTYQNLGWETDGGAILRLDKESGEPDFHPYSVEETNSFFMVFCFLCTAYHAVRRSRDIQREAKAARKAQMKAQAAEEAKAAEAEAEEDPY